MSEARVELAVSKGTVSIPRGIRINGIDVPNVESAFVDYSVGIPRKLTLVIIPTDVAEVDVNEW